MKKLFFAAIAVSLLSIGSTAIAQTYEVPKNYTLKAKEDYPKYEQDVINTIDWLQQNPWDEQLDKRKEANTFLIAWITGSPDVSISVGSPLVKLCDKNKELMITFMGGFTKYSIQHKSEPANTNAANVAGLRALIDKYKAEKNHVKDSAVEKLIKVDNEGKLDEWAKTEYLKS